MVWGGEGAQGPPPACPCPEEGLPAPHPTPERQAASLPGSHPSRMTPTEQVLARESESYRIQRFQNFSYVLQYSHYPAELKLQTFALVPVVLHINANRVHYLVIQTLAILVD